MYYISEISRSSRCTPFDDIYHHGRNGQKWGVRNGPPYPLSRNAVKTGYGKKKFFKSNKINPSEGTKAKTKEEILKKGSATEVLNISNDLTTQELQDALVRIRVTNSLAEYSQKELDQGWKSIDQIMKKVGNVKDWSKTGLELYKVIDEVMGIAKNKQKASSGK